MQRLVTKLIKPRRPGDPDHPGATSDKIRNPTGLDDVVGPGLGTGSAGLPRDLPTNYGSDTVLSPVQAPNLDDSDDSEDEDESTTSGDETTSTETTSADTGPYPPLSNAQGIWPSLSSRPTSPDTPLIPSPLPDDMTGIFGFELSAPDRLFRSLDATQLLADLKHWQDQLAQIIAVPPAAALCLLKSYNWDQDKLLQECGRTGKTVRLPHTSPTSSFAAPVCYGDATFKGLCVPSFLYLPEYYRGYCPRASVFLCSPSPPFVPLQLLS